MGQYYLHTNGSLIYKPHGGVEHDSPFVKRVWEINDMNTPQGYTTFLKEAWANGANRDEIERMINHNVLDQYIPDCREQIYG